MSSKILNVYYYCTLYIQGPQIYHLYIFHSQIYPYHVRVQLDLFIFLEVK